MSKIAQIEKMISGFMLHFSKYQGFGGLFLDKERQTNKHQKNSRKKQEDGQKKKPKPKQTKSLLCFFWHKDSTENIPTSRNKNQKHNKNQDPKTEL